MTTSYSNVFNDSNVNPAAISLASYSISSDLILTWPNALSSTSPYALINEVSATTTGLNVFLPDATQGGNGYSGWFNNTGSDTFTVVNAGGQTIVAISPGQLWAIYLRDNSTVNGTWYAYQIGSVVTQANAAMLAGYGLTAISTTLNTVYVPADKSNNYAIQTTDRASMLFLTTGSFSFTMLSPGTAGSGWYVVVKNSGAGTLTVSPNSSETIDGNTSIQLLSEESTILMTDGLNWYTLGRGRILNYSTSKIVIALPGTGTTTLTSAQAANQILQFTGTLTGNSIVIVPSTVQVYYVENMTTGSYSLTVQTLSGSGVSVSAHTILVCDGINVNPAQDAGIGTITGVIAGTGLSGGGFTSTVTLNIANTSVTVGTYGDASDIPMITVNQQGQLTSVATVPVSVSINSVTNSMLAPMSSLTIKSNLSSSVNNPQDNTLSQILDSTISTSQGTIVYRGGNFWQGLSPGVPGQILGTQGTSANINWINPSAVNQQIFTSSSTWNTPTVGTIALVQGWGAGGSGGNSGFSGSIGGGGGGGGGYSEKWILLSAFTSTVSVTIGAGGVGQASQGSGSAGGNSTFGSYLTAYGGGGGDGSNTGDAGGGGGGTQQAGTTPTGPTGGAGGQVGGGTGGNAAAASISVTTSFGGGGGGGGDNGGISGGFPGGFADFGGGGGGGGANGSPGSGGISTYGGNGGAGGGTNGSTGTAPAGAGGGCHSGTSGAGAAGQIIITVF